MNDLLELLDAEEIDGFRIDRNATVDPQYITCIIERGDAIRVIEVGKQGEAASVVVERAVAEIEYILGQPGSTVVEKHTEIARPGHLRPHTGWFLRCRHCLSELKGPFDKPSEALASRKDVTSPCQCWADEWKIEKEEDPCQNS